MYNIFFFLVKAIKIITIAVGVLTTNVELCLIMFDMPYEYEVSVRNVDDLFLYYRVDIILLHIFFFFYSIHHSTSILTLY